VLGSHIYLSSLTYNFLDQIDADTFKFQPTKRGHVKREYVDLVLLQRPPLDANEMPADSTYTNCTKLIQIGARDAQFNSINAV
jgi:hypothetical protein